MNKKLVMVALFALAVVPSVFASGTGMPWEEGLQEVLNALTGTTARIIGGIGIAAGGIMLMTTRGQGLSAILWIIVGLGVLVNAVSLFDRFFGNPSGAVVPAQVGEALRVISSGLGVG